MVATRFACLSALVAFTVVAPAVAEPLVAPSLFDTSAPATASLMPCRPAADNAGSAYQHFVGKERFAAEVSRVSCAPNPEKVRITIITVRPVTELPMTAGQMCAEMREFFYNPEPLSRISPAGLTCSDETNAALPKKPGTNG
jgi:hypothetical protein